MGVFVGVEPSGIIACMRNDVFTPSGGSLSITSGRLSYALGLVGACYSIETACASTLVALHVSTMTVVGEQCCDGIVIGTKVLSEDTSRVVALAGMISPHGRSHTFDERADGYCRGEGCGSFVVSFGENKEMLFVVRGSAV